MLFGILALLFLPDLYPGMTVFSNDGPLGTLNAHMNAKPDGYGLIWNDLNWIGGSMPGPTPVSITGFLQTPLMPSISAAIIAFTAAFYRPHKPRHFNIFRMVSIASCLAIAVPAEVCALLGLFGVISFYDYPWMFFFAPAVVGWFVTFGICYIIVESQKESN